LSRKLGRNRCGRHASSLHNDLQEANSKKFPVIALFSGNSALETGFAGLVRPPPSLRKPQVSGTTPNRAFLRGFPAFHFSDFGLCRHSSAVAAIFGALSPHPKIPFPAAVAEHEV